MNKIDIIQNHHFNPEIVKNISSISSWNPKEVVHFHNTIGNKETPYCDGNYLFDQFLSKLN